MNFVEPYLQMVFEWMGVSDFTSIAVEFDEFGGASMEQSLARTEAKVDHLVNSWTGSLATAA
jgi:FMN-dependent NADH-azoreductase